VRPVATDLRVEAEDRPGTLAAIGEALGKASINLEGFCAVTSAGRGYLHLLVEDGAAARQALEAEGITVSAEHEVILLTGVEDRPGYLGEMARRIADTGVNIDVSYLATGTRIVFGVADKAKAESAL
jgi:hypothetical protein